MASICVGNTFYIFGGMGISGTSKASDISNDFWKFDLNSYQWELLHENDFSTSYGNDSYPCIRRFAALAEGRKSIYLFGGCSVKDRKPYFLHDVWQYNIKKNKWILLSPHFEGHYNREEYPLPRYTATAFYHKNMLYIWGGCTLDQENKSYLFLNDLWRFELNSCTWERILIEDDNPSARYGHCYQYHKGCLYIFGGYSRKGDEGDFWMLDLESFKWVKYEKEITSFLPEPRYCGLLEVCGDGHLMLFGGRRKSDSRKNYADTWIYDIKNHKWKELQFVNGPYYHAKMGSGSNRNHIFMFGGEGPHGHVSDFWVFYSKILKWSIIHGCRNDDPLFW